MTGGCDARRPVDVQADIIVGGENRQAGMDANANADAVVSPRLGGKASLGAGRGGDGVGRILEHHEERVALGLDLNPSVVAPARPKEFMVPLEHRAVARPKGLEQPRRPFEVREHEGDDSGGQGFCSHDAPWGIRPHRV